VAWVVPSARVIVPNVPGREAPDAAVTGPVTGGHKVAHEPVQFDLVEVSIANQ
jgi:hypothetical protein